MLEFRDLEARWGREALAASRGLLDRLRLNWLADAEVSLSPGDPGKMGLSLFFTDPFELEAAMKAIPLPAEVLELENAIGAKFDLVPRTWLKLHLVRGQMVGISQYFVIDARNSYPITTLRLGLRMLGLKDVSRIEPAFQSVLGQPGSLWAVIAKRDGEAVRPRISGHVLASSVPDLLKDIQVAGYASEDCVRDLTSAVEATCPGSDRVYVSLDPDHLNALSIDFQANDQTPRASGLDEIWGSGPQRRYLKLRVLEGQRVWTLYRPYATMVRPPAFAPAARAYYDGYSPEICDAFGETYQAGPIVKGASLAERLSIEPGTRVLDAGCGAGGPAMELAREGARVWGVTISPTQAGLARQAVAKEGIGDKVKIVAADYHRLPFPSESFDRVMFMETIGYADLPKVAIEAHRVLAAGGLVYVKDPMVQPRELKPDEEFELAEFDRLYGQSTPKVEQVSAALTGAGFDILVCRCIDAEVDTASFHKRMFDGKGLSPFGKSHYRAFRMLPVSFYEILARKK